MFVTIKGVTVVSHKAVWYNIHMVKITANSMDKRILVGYNPRIRRVRHDWSDLAQHSTRRLICDLSQEYPLQFSCLENPMDRGAWWATVHGSPRVGHDWATSLHFHLVKLLNFSFLMWAGNTSTHLKGCCNNYIRPGLVWIMNRVPGLSEKMLSLFSFPFVLITHDVVISWHLFLECW